MSDGWIKLYRKIIGSPVFDNPDLFKVWVWCMCKASHCEHEAIVGRQTVKLQPGQFVFGRKVAADELKMNESSVYRYIKKLESMGNITINPNNKFSLINIENWGFYQDEDSSSEQQMNNKRTTDEQQMNTYKNVKNVKNVNNGKNIRRNEIIHCEDGTTIEIDKFGVTTFY